MEAEQLEQFEDLARRAVACKHWRWMPGMRAVDGAERFRVSVISHGYPQGVDEQPPMKVNVDLGLRWFPDLTDPATLGCLLALVREAHNAPAAYLMGSVSKQWTVHHFAEPEGYWKPLSKWQPTEAAALVAALEAAP